MLQQTNIIQKYKNVTKHPIQNTNIKNANILEIFKNTKNTKYFKFYKIQQNA